MFQKKKLMIALFLMTIMLLSVITAVAEGPVKYDTPKSFTLWCSMDKAAGAISDWSENLVYQEMARLTNVKVNFLHPPVGGETDAFNLLVASNEYPDAIQYGWLNVPGGPAKYIEDEVIIPLNDLLEQYAPNLMAWLNARPEIKKQCVMDDGTFYVLPAIYADIELATHQGPVIREDMLAKIGMTVDELPTTIQEWEEMLLLVKNNPEMENVIPFFFETMRNITDSPVILGAFGITQEFYKGISKNLMQYSPKYDIIYL